MLPGYFLSGGLGSTVGLTGAIASPLELLLVLTFCLWVAQGLADAADLRGGPGIWAGRCWRSSRSCWCVGLVRGAIGGGDLNIALWESRFLFYTVICFVLAANTIRTRAQLRALITIGMVAMGLYAIEGAYRRIFLLDTKPDRVIMEFAYSHEVVIFLGALPCCWSWRSRSSARRSGSASRPVHPRRSAVYTLLATERRAGYIAVIVAFLAFALVLLMRTRKAFFSWSPCHC